MRLSKSETERVWGIRFVGPNRAFVGTPMHESKRGATLKSKSTLASIADTAIVAVAEGWAPNCREMGRGTLAHFFAENFIGECDQDDIRNSLVECGSYEGGGGAMGKYTLVLVRDDEPAETDPHADWIRARARGCQEDQ